MKDISREEKAKQLQKLKGVGETLSHRFVEAGLDSFEKIAAAGEEGIRIIKGINPRLVASIIAQSAEEVEEASRDKAQKVEELRRRSAGIRDQTQALAISVRDRFIEQPPGADAKKVEKELVKMIASLERVEGKLGKRMKRAGKCLAKAEQHLVALSGAGLKKIGKGLRKARKTLKKVYA